MVVYRELHFLHRQPPTHDSIPDSSRNRQDAYPQGRSQEDPRVSLPLHHSSLRRNRELDIRMHEISNLDLELHLTPLYHFFN